ncbi:MAG: preprotein translocase subunit SecE [Gammaproteobacteria bacterium]|nr:preprotein translocase subunit SecE [Gammaproteobacteria bacterium]
MNAQVETAYDRLDTLKLTVAALLVCTGMAGYYVFSGHSLLLRVVGLLACALVALIIALRTEKGRAVTAFLHEAQIEVRKVVWPTRDETLQTTGIVIIVVIGTALFLWVLDWFLGWGIQFVIGTGS